MRNHKRLVLLIASMGLLLCGCSGKEETPMQAWLKTADLSAEEMADELYERALDEDILQIYTVSGRIYDVAEAFQEEYPGLLVEVTYLRSEELAAQVVENAENSDYG